MAGFLSLFDGTVVVDVMTGAEVATNAPLPEWWARVKKTLAQGDYERATAFLVGDMGLEAAVDMSAGDDAQVGAATYKQRTDVIGYQRELVRAALEDWNLTDLVGDRLPIANDEDRKRSIAKLPPAAFMAIYQVVQKYNQPRTAKDAATFPDASDDGGQEREPGTGDAGAALTGAGALDPAGS